VRSSLECGKLLPLSLVAKRRCCRCRFANCQLPAANCLPSASKQLAGGETVDIIPIDTIGRTVRHNAHHSGALTGGLLQQRYAFDEEMR